MSDTDLSAVRVGIAGLGRSGWNIHAKTLQSLPDRYQVVAAFDPEAERRQDVADTFGARVYEDYESLIADGDVELVVVASPNLLHPPHTITALDAGKHVVCEKPLATSVELIDDMIAARDRSGKVFAPFQNRRYEPHLLKVKEVIDSGVLGEIVQVRIAWHGFGRRWDWQTLKEFGGGSLNNNGPHMIDHGLFILGELNGREPEVSAELKRTLTLGDAEDHVRVTLRAAGAPTIDMEMTSVAAFPQDRWHIMGTAGGLQGTDKALSWKWVDWSAMPERQVLREPTEGRTYGGEKLNWQSDAWEHPADSMPVNQRFYEELYATLREGKPLFVTPESVRRQVMVLERCKALSPV